MTAKDIFVQLFQTKSFDSIWYWMLLAVSWSLTTYWTMGVGHHEALQARRKGGRYLSDFETLVGIYCNRIDESVEHYGPAAMLIISFLLATLATLGFWFWVLFAQALFLLLFPLFVASLVSMHTATRQVRKPVSGAALIRRYRRLRAAKQAIGVFAIMSTSIWGALINFRIPAV